MRAVGPPAVSSAGRSRRSRTGRIGRGDLVLDSANVGLTYNDLSQAANITVTSQGRAHALTPNALLGWMLSQSADGKTRIGWMAAGSRALHVRASSDGVHWSRLPPVTLSQSRALAYTGYNDGADELLADSHGDTFAVWRKKGHRIGSAWIARGSSSWHSVHGSISDVRDFSAFPIPGGILLDVVGRAALSVYSATTGSPTWHKETSFPVAGADSISLSAVDVADDGRAALGYILDEGSAVAKLAFRSAAGTWSLPTQVPRVVEGVRFIPGGTAVLGDDDHGGLYGYTYSAQGSLETSVKFPSREYLPALYAAPFGTFDQTSILGSVEGYVSAAEPSQPSTRVGLLYRQHGSHSDVDDSRRPAARGPRVPLQD